MDRVGPFSFTGDEVGFEAEEEGLASAVVRLIGDREIELPPVRERKERGIADGDAFAEAGGEPAEETVEAAGGGDAERNERLARSYGVLEKIDLITKCRFAEGDEWFAGSGNKTKILLEFIGEGAIVEAVEGRL